MRIKSFKLFESVDFTEALSILEDRTSDFTDLGYTIEEVNTQDYFLTSRGQTRCLSFEICSKDGSYILFDCYDALKELKTHLENELGMTISLDMHFDTPHDLESAIDVFGGTWLEDVIVLIHKQV